MATYFQCFDSIMIRISAKQVSEAVVQNAVKCLVDVVNSETAPLASVAMEALGHIGICGPLPLLVNDSSPGQFIPIACLYLVCPSFS